MNTPEYRQPTHREDLERELVHGAATHIASEPHHAGAIAEAIKTVLDTLYPIAATPTSGPDNAHAAAVLYPAIERAMGELSKLHEGFNMEVNRAFNILRDALWSECPAPASAVPKRRETPAVEPAGLPVIDPGPDSLEREIQAKADKGPRVMPAALKAEIASAHFFTAADGVQGAYRAGGDVHPVGGTPSQAAHQTLGLLTICVLVLRNGFTVTGESACASPENFDAEVGRRIARENAINKVWPLLGFRLRDELARPVLTEGDVTADAAGTCRPDNHTSACTACKRA